MNRGQLIVDLIRDEGKVLKPYRDTVGKLTIGIGRNLDDVGISEEEAKMLLDNDIAKVEAEIGVRLPWYGGLDEVRQRVLCNMAFNMGMPTLLTFVNTLRHIEHGEWDQAAAGMLNSKWAGQVGQRAARLAEMMRNG